MGPLKSGSPRSCTLRPVDKKALTVSRPALGAAHVRKTYSCRTICDMCPTICFTPQFPEGPVSGKFLSKNVLCISFPCHCPPSLNLVEFLPMPNPTEPPSPPLPRPAPVATLSSVPPLSFRSSPSHHFMPFSSLPCIAPAVFSPQRVFSFKS